eukprot:4143143-Ditylum_brightwellii.AAC.1
MKVQSVDKCKTPSQHLLPRKSVPTTRWDHFSADKQTVGMQRTSEYKHYITAMREYEHKVQLKNRCEPPLCVVQEELGGKRAEAACGTVKVVVLKGDIHASDIIVASSYNPKPLCMIPAVTQK